MPGAKRNQQSKKQQQAAAKKEQQLESSGSSELKATQRQQELHDGDIHIFFKEIRARALPLLSFADKAQEQQRSLSDFADHDRLPLQLEASAPATSQRKLTKNKASKTRRLASKQILTVHENRTAFLRRRQTSKTSIEDTKPRDDALKAEIRKTRRQSFKINQDLNQRLGSEQQQQQQQRVAAQPIGADQVAAQEEHIKPASIERNRLHFKPAAHDNQRAADALQAHQDPNPNRPRAYHVSPSRQHLFAAAQAIRAPHQHISQTHQNQFRPVQGRAFNFGMHQRPMLNANAIANARPRLVAGHTNAANPYFMIPK